MRPFQTRLPVVGIALPAALAVLFSAILAASPVHAASGTWSGQGPDGLWSDASNWSGGIVPGTLGSTTNGDTATFNLGAAGIQSTVTVDATRNVENISFDTSAGSYTVGGTGGSALTLSLGGTASILSTFTSVNTDIETVNAPLTLEGGYTLADNSTTGAMLDFGGPVNGAASGSLAVGGLGGITIGGQITNNAGAVLLLAKSGAGYAFLTNANNSYTGGSQVASGILDFVSGALGSSGTITTTGGEFQYAPGNTQDISTRFIAGGGGVDTGGNNVNWAGVMTATNWPTTFFFKYGAGALEISGANTGLSAMGSQSGTALSIYGGILDLDFTTHPGLVNSKVPAGRAPALFDGTLKLNGNATTSSSQSFSNGGGVGLSGSTGGLGEVMLLNNGAAPNAAGVLLTLGTIGRSAGQTYNFMLPGNGTDGNPGVNGDQATTNGITTTSVNTAFTGGASPATILGGWAIVNGTTWATTSDSAGTNNITGLTSYSGSFAAATDVDAPTGASAPTAGTYNSWRFNSSTGSYTVNPAGNITIASGGILETPNVGPNPVAIGTAGTTISLASGFGAELIVSQNNAAATMTVNSLLAGGTLTKAGAGTVLLTNGNNSYGASGSGQASTFISGGFDASGNPIFGALEVPSDPNLDTAGSTYLGAVPSSAAVGVNNIVLTSGVLQFASSGSGGNTMTLAANRGIGLNGLGGGIDTGNNTVNYGGVISNTSLNSTSNLGNFTKLGGGALILAGSSAYTGYTAIDAGTLELNYAAATSPASLILYRGVATGPLVLGGGALLVQGTAVAGSYTSQAFAAVTVGAGESAIVAATGGSDNVAVTLNAITRSTGGTVDFTLPSGGTLGSNNGIVTTTANAIFTGGQQTILGGWATVGGFSTWAVANPSGAGSIAGLTTYSSTFAAGADVDAPLGASAPAAGSTFNSWRFNSAGASTVNPTGNITIASGGILETSNVGSGNPVAVGAPGTPNTLTSANGQDLIVLQNNSAAPMTINSIIANNGPTSIGLTKSGAGTLNIAGANAYNGPTSVNAGTLALTGAALTPLANTAVGVSPGATLAFLPGVAGSGYALGSTAASLTLNAGATFDMADGAIETLTIKQQSGTTGISLNNATLDFDVSNTAADELVTTGAVAGVGINTVNLVLPSSGPLPSTITLISGASAASGALSGIGLGGGSYVFAGSGTNTENVTVGGILYGLKLTGTATSLQLSAAPPPQWAGFVSGTPDWSAAANWTSSPAYPHLAGDTATFGSLIGANNQTINLTSASVTVGSIAFNNSTATTSQGNYTIAASTGHSLTLDNSGAGAAITNSEGANTISAAVTLNDNLSIGVAASTSLTMASIAGDATGSNSQTVTVSGGGAASIGGISNGSGGGTVALSMLGGGSGNGVLTLTAASAYSGATNVSGGTLLGGAAGAFSSASSVNVAAGATLNLGGFNQAIASLAGAGNVTTSGASGTATLAVGSAASTTFSGLLSNAPGGQLLALTKLGGSTLTLSNTANSFSGGAAVDSGGTVIAVAPGSLGAGPITLVGGAVRPNATSFSLAGFNGGVNWTVNNSGISSAPFPFSGTLQLTDGNTNVGRSAFYDSEVPVVSGANGFNATFTYQYLGTSSSAPADGVEFVLQQDSRGPRALGTGGGSKGYLGAIGTGISPSVAFGINIAAANQGVGVSWVGGATSPATNLSVSPVDLVSTDPINVTLSYNPATNVLTEILVDTFSGSTFIHTDNAIDVPYSLLGATSAYVGFTGGSGGDGAVQQISNFAYSIGSPAAAYGNSVVLAAGTTSTIDVGATVASPAIAMGPLAVQSGAASTLEVTASTAPLNLAYGLTLGAVTLAANVSFNVSNNGSGAGTLQLGPIGDGGAGYGIATTGPGTVVLTAGGVFSGGASVSAGTLRVANPSGSATGSGPVIVNGGGTLSGSTPLGQGFIGGPVDVTSGGAIAAFSGATLTLSGGLTLAAGSASTFNLAAPNGTSGGALIATSGGSGTSFVVSGGHTINLSGLPQPGVFDLFSYTGAPLSATAYGHLSLGVKPGLFTYQLVNNTAGSQVDLDVTPVGITWTGASDSNWDTATGNWAFAGTPLDYADGATVTFADKNPLTGSLVSAAGSTTATVQTGGVQPTSILFTNTGSANGGVDYTLANAINSSTGAMDTVGIAGPAGITLNGAGGVGSVGGAVFLQGPNSFTGAVAVNAGRLQLQNSAGLGNSSGVTVAAGTAVELSGATGTSTTFGSAASGPGGIPLSLSGTGLTGAAAGALNNVSGNNGYAGPIAIAAGGAAIGSSSAAAGDGLTLSGGINTAGNSLSFIGPGSTLVGPSQTGSGVIGGGGGVAMNGSGTLALTAANNYGGGTTISSGTLAVANNSALGGGGVTLAGGRLQLLGTGAPIGVNIAATQVGTAYEELSSTATAGAPGAAIQNWNNFLVARNRSNPIGNAGNTPTGSSSVPFALLDANAAGTTAALTAWSARDSYSVSTTPEANNDAQLFNGYISAGPNVQSFSTVTIGGVPYASYRVYVYLGGGTAQNEVSISNSSTSYYASLPAAAPVPLYVQAASTTPGTYTANANYAVFSGLSGASFTITDTADNNGSYGGIAAIEIVATGGTAAMNLANSVNVTANSTIDVTGANAATLGNATINSTAMTPTVLSITGGSTGAGAPYTLTLGTVSLVGGSAGFNVANNGGGAGTLVLGPIADSGHGYGITLAGGGTLNLTTGGSYSGGTTIQSGTVVINGDTALGAAPGSPTTNVTFSGNGTLQFAAGFAGPLSSNRDIAVNSGVTATIDTNGQNIAGGGALILASSATLIKTDSSGTGTLELDAPPNLGNGSTVAVTSGTLRLKYAGAATIGANVNFGVSGGATLELAGSVSQLSQAVNIGNAGTLLVSSSVNQNVGVVSGTGNTVVNAGGSLTAYQIRQNSLTINASGTVTLVPSGSGSTADPAGPNNTNFSSRLTSLSIAGTTNAWTGTLDIGNNGLVIAYGSGADPYSTIDNMIASGYSGGAWTGTGITSSLARAAVALGSQTPALNIGLIDFTPGAGNYSNTTFIVFEGQTVTTNAILLRLTYMDDLVLAGNMLGSNATNDALTFAANYGTGTTWSLGDLTHAGLTNSSAALLFAANYTVGLPSLDGTTGGEVALGIGEAAVPEPSSLLLASLGALGIALLARRRRRG